jgi:hypothetical protein
MGYTPVLFLFRVVKERPEAIDEKKQLLSTRTGFLLLAKQFPSLVPSEVGSL